MFGTGCEISFSTPWFFFLIDIIYNLLLLTDCFITDRPIEDTNPITGYSKDIENIFYILWHANIWPYPKAAARKTEITQRKTHKFAILIDTLEKKL